MRKAGIVGGIFAVVLLGVILYASMRFEQVTCEVCIDFQGRTQCRKAAGTDRETAMQAARDNACAFVVQSKTEGFLCAQTPPARVACQAS